VQNFHHVLPLSLHHYYLFSLHTALSALARLSEVIIANYPETVAHMLVVRAPRVFPLLWQLVSCFFDPNTRKKIIVYGGNDYQVRYLLLLCIQLHPLCILQDTGGLRDYIPSECVPDFLGGSCQVSHVVLYGHQSSV